VQQWKAFKEGNQEEAMRIQKKLLPLVVSYFNVPFPEKIKTLLHLQGRAGGYPRKPMQLVDPALQQTMKEALKHAGIEIRI
jgi:dihydrodipicolinate synthase/N-acetylneuraminate lyase